jgi:branched-chain amino acid transport system permease protein
MVAAEAGGIGSSVCRRNRRGEALTTTIWSGLTLGAVYVMVSLGFTLSLLPSGIFNFAQGAIVVGGTFLTYQWLSDSLPLIVVIALNTVAGATMGILCELLAVRPLRRGGGDTGQSELITTVAVSTAFIGLMSVLWGDQALKVPFSGPTAPVHFLGISADPVEVMLVTASIVVGLGLHFGFRRTRWGQACLAVAEDREAASVRGVNVNLLSLCGFAGAGILGTLSAILIGPITYASPLLTNVLALGGFVAIAMGGHGSFVGSVFGGLLVGVVSAFATRYLGSDWTSVTVLALLLATLAVRPTGLGGVAMARNV